MMKIDFRNIDPTAKKLFIAAVILFLIAGIFLRLVRSTTRSRPDAQFRDRAQRYIHRLKSQSPSSLNLEQKLLLFHSYAIERQNVAGLVLYESMKEELTILPPDRQATFQNMADQMRANLPSKRRKTI